MGGYEEKAVRERRTQVLIGELQGLAPDVVALNEANNLPRYGRRLARALGFDRVWHVGLGGLRAGCLGIPANLREGDVTLARPELELRRAGRKQPVGWAGGQLLHGAPRICDPGGGRSHPRS